MSRLWQIAPFCCLFVATAQTQDRLQTADRAIAANPQTAGVVDKILSLVGPYDAKVLSQRERFEQYLLNTVGPVPLFGEALSAGLNQWSNTPGEWGQGWGAYGKRYASNLGYNAARQTIAYGVATVFHEDSRYFASHQQGVWPRVRHALVSTVTARHPGGNRRFSVSTVTGIVGGVAIQSTWGPPSMQTSRSIAINTGISLGTTAGFNLVREFLPDLLGRKNRHRNTSTLPSPATPIVKGERSRLYSFEFFNDPKVRS